MINLNLKDILLYAAVGLLCFTVFFGGRNYNQRVTLAEELTEIRIYNASLFSQIVDRDSLLASSDVKYEDLLKSYEAKEAEIAQIKKKKAKVDADKAKLIAELSKISSDSSYSFLQDSVYISSIEPKTYGFDSVQVKEIHADYIGKVHLEKVNSILEAEVVAYVDKCEVCDSLLVESRVQNSLLKSNIVNYKELVDSGEKEAELYKEQAIKNANRKTFWQTVAGVAGIVAVGLAIL